MLITPPTYNRMYVYLTVIQIIIIVKDVVFVTPTGAFVSVFGGSASFSCVTPASSNDFVDMVQWMVNDTVFEDLELDNVVFDPSSRVLRFSMLNTPRYNNTRIKCSGTLKSGNVFTSRNTLLLIQG